MKVLLGNSTLYLMLVHVYLDGNEGNSTLHLMLVHVYLDGNEYQLQSME